MHYLLFQNNGTQSIMKFDIISDGSEVVISIILIRIKSILLLNDHCQGNNVVYIVY